MSLLGPRPEPAQPVPVSRNAAFKCDKCGHTEKQLKTVSAVYHRCPKTRTMRVLKREV